MLDAVSQFRDAIAVRGLYPDHIVADGTIQYCPADSKAGNGRYALHLDDRPAGWFINHGDGLGVEKWKANMPRRQSTLAEAKAQSERRRAQQEHHGGCEAERHAKAAELAKSMWAEAWVAHVHPYLSTKDVQQHGIRCLDGKLLIPVRIDGVLTSLQTINGSGAKRFLPGGKVVGGSHRMGKPKGRIIIAEGYATAASIHEATGDAVVVAFDCGNLLPVAQSIRKAYPYMAIILAADDDFCTPGNPGIVAASGAAVAVGGRVVVPEFGDPEARGNRDTDFNDLAYKLGKSAVREAFHG